MSQLVLISHGTFCVELKKSVEMIMGPQDNIQTVALLPSEGPEDFALKFAAATKDVAGLTVFADLAGGTPCNVATKELMSGADFDLYAGMNMPMLISFINGELIGTQGDVVAEAQQGIVNVKQMLADMATDDDED